MKASELRIGNWIYLHFKEKIISAELFKIMLVSTDDHALKSYRPIPLTEEWLRKFGFEQDKDDIFTINNVMFWLDDGRLQIADGYTPLINAPCKYVHQLQNLYFALTGEELKLQNHFQPK